MILLMVVPAVLLLVDNVMMSPTDLCGTVNSNTCAQQCNATSCHCGGRAGSLSYNTCHQACEGAECKQITCSSGTCYQKCHNCHMECTADVNHCDQQCLSGVCSFSCKAKRCIQECTGGKCRIVTTRQDQSRLQVKYLAILAGLFAAMAILSCLALALSCSETHCCRRKQPYLRLRVFGSSVERLCSQTSIA